MNLLHYRALTRSQATGHPVAVIEPNGVVVVYLPGGGLSNRNFVSIEHARAQIEDIEISPEQ